MKNVLDIYLQKHGLTRIDLLRSGELSEAQLARISKRDPEKYSVKTLDALANELNVNSDELLADLKNIRDSQELYEVTDMNELRQRVKEQEEEFLVKGDLRELLKEIKRSQVSEMAETGFDLGSSGSGSLGARGVLRVINFFEEDSKTENLKQDIAQLYTIKFIDEAAAKLRLKQLDY